MDNLKYHVFCYIRDHGNRVPCSELNEKFNLDSDYLGSLAGVTSHGDEFQIWGETAQLTAQGFEYIDKTYRDLHPPLKPSLDAASKTALARLYETPEGVPFDDLGISEAHYLHLLGMNLIEEPDGLTFQAWGGTQISHGGNVILTVAGRACWEQIAEAKAEQDRQNRNNKIREETRLKERAEDKKDAERRYRGQNWVTIFAALLGSVVGFVLGVIAEHFAGIVSMIH